MKVKKNQFWMGAKNGEIVLTLGSVRDLNPDELSILSSEYFIPADCKIWALDVEDSKGHSTVIGPPYDHVEMHWVYIGDM